MKANTKATWTALLSNRARGRKLARRTPLRLCLQGALPLALCWVQPAYADCVSPSRGGDDALIARISQATIDAHQALYDGQKYKMLEEFGWGEGNRQEEFTSHFFATLLINHGVVGADPPVWQNPATGQWEYPAQALSFSTTFHRSWDSYALLGFDDFAYSCQDINPHTGERFCDPARRSLFSNNIENMGVDLGTGVIDMIPNSPGSTAQFRGIHDLFKDPDHLITYSCGALDDPHGLVAMARTIIHENWHATAAPGHIDGTGSENYDGPIDNACIKGAERCDAFVGHATTSARMFGGLSHQQFEGVGAYQVDQEFMCDLVESPADWIPLQTQAVAQAHFEARAQQSRFVNVDPDGDPTTPGGQLPFDCGEPLSILSVAADGSSVSCTNGDPCATDADCNDSDSSTSDMCGAASCCVYNPVCANNEPCQSDAECDDGDSRSYDTCEANNCCAHEVVK